MIGLRFKHFLAIAGLILIFSSCTTSKNLKSYLYLNDVSDSVQISTIKAYEARFQPGDRLAINVSALNPGSAAPYNLSTGATGVASASVPTGGYLVDDNGTISFPQLGKIKVAGLTRADLTDQLTTLLEKFLKDPIVTVQFLNFRVTVLGEVNHPGAIALPEGKMTIIEAIGQSGDLTIFGRRDNILVMREKDGKRELGRVNLTSTKVFSSPYYQLQQNDVVYVEMTEAKVPDNDQKLARNVSLAASIVSVLTALILVVVNLTK